MKYALLIRSVKDRWLRRADFRSPFSQPVLDGATHGENALTSGAKAEKKDDR